ncbi:dTDP-glucose 4,6-dehydratase [archaeon]|nr:dTDP-glucose 4,6-dehydratase [archaeon]
MPCPLESTILITGGAGFIGSNYLWHLNKHHPNAKLVNLDSLTYCGNLANLEGLKNNYTFIKGNICDSQLVNKIFEDHQPNIIVNFAAESHVDRSILDPQLFLKTNIIGTQVLLDAAKKHMRDGLFLQVSTDEVYGSLGPEGCFTEESALKPNSPYSASKTSADLIAYAYYKTYGLPVIITRCSNNYGPYQFPEKLIPLMINNILQLKKLPVYGDGKNVRDWLYVEDHCKAITQVIEKGTPGQIYNIGGHNEMQNIAIVKLLIDKISQLLQEESYAKLANPDKINYDLIDFVKDRPGHDKRYAIDPTKIENEIGWTPETTFEQGIVKTIKWYLDNLKWSQNIINGEYKNYYQNMYGK